MTDYTDRIIPAGTIVLHIVLTSTVCKKDKLAKYIVQSVRDLDECVVDCVKSPLYRLVPITRGVTYVEECLYPTTKEVGPIILVRHVIHYFIPPLNYPPTKSRRTAMQLMSCVSAQLAENRASSIMNTLPGHMTDAIVGTLSDNSGVRVFLPQSGVKYTRCPIGFDTNTHDRFVALDGMPIVFSDHMAADKITFDVMTGIALDRCDFSEVYPRCRDNAVLLERSVSIPACVICSFNARAATYAMRCALQMSIVRWRDTVHREDEDIDVEAILA